ncbi:MAG: nitrogen fixation protein NifH, partial [Actinomycetota bacterium]
MPWLLEQETPAVRHLALRWMLDEPEDAPIVRRARAAAMRTDPIAATLAAQHPDGYWVEPGPGYGPKYTGTVWSLMFLDQLGSDQRDRGILRACVYVLDHTQA